ncbi:hypothetical protein D9758_014155 [Tetrapyrgos nigripes]|uniref:Methyltransferase domain-containing protein n=1 Tax=Tetrapyrgos nigripes TaxID=182062 RepID=A0A8H5CMI4_9AGAR|nr:hypothetical protein D9758_014155 [Tetrapyrgos nigripes]
MSTKSNTSSPYENIQKNQAEGRRLEDQYGFYKKHIRKNTIIFDEAVTMSDDAVVLDVGTGRGSWLLDLARTAPPSISLYGVDICTTFFPSHGSNIAFSEHSCTALPQGWTNKFDFVNQNLLAASLTRGDWITDIQEIFRVTKPGGHIQLYEPSCANWDCPPDSANGKMKALFKALFDSNSLMSDIGERLSPMLTDAGFVDVRAHNGTYPVNANDGRQGKEGARLTLLWLRCLQPSMLRLGILNSDREYELLIEEIQKEWDEGVPYQNHFLFYATKPVA